MIRMRFLSLWVGVEVEVEVGHELRCQDRALFESSMSILIIYNINQKVWGQPNIQQGFQPCRFFKIPWLVSLVSWRVCRMQGTYLALQAVLKRETRHILYPRKWYRVFTYQEHSMLLRLFVQIYYQYWLLSNQLQASYVF